MDYVVVAGIKQRKEEKITGKGQESVDKKRKHETNKIPTNNRTS